MDVIIRHQVHKALPAFVLDSMPKIEADKAAAAPKRKAEQQPDGHSPAKQSVCTHDSSKPVASATGDTKTCSSCCRRSVCVEQKRLVFILFSDYVWRLRN